MNKTYWPDGKSFAFTIIDDTDKSTLENALQVYDYLYSKRVLTTKSVWVREGKNSEEYTDFKGTTLLDNEYTNWVKSLQDKGYEICLHSMTWSASTRDQIIDGFNRFESLFGKSNVLIQHNDIVANESIYWGSKRLIFPLNLIYELISKINSNHANSQIYQGENTESMFFWGDICKKKVEFIRNLVFPSINLFNVTPYVVHKRSSTKYVNNWFVSCEAPDATSFVKLLSNDNIEKLVNENGLCIVYTHFGKAFVENGILKESFKKAITYLTNKNGWFVPASEIFNHLEKKSNGIKELTYLEELQLSWKWLRWKMLHGTS